MEKRNEVEKFFEGLPSEDKAEADIFNTNSPAKVEPEVPAKETDEDEEPRKNRRHRRLEEQLQKERESNIALNERVKTLAEVAREREIEKAGMNVDERFIRLFGDTDTGKEISRQFTHILAETKTAAEENALNRFNEQQMQVVQQQREYESFIDEQLEALEDFHNVDLTSDAPKARKARREFLEMVQDLSPKDQDGTITDYADFGSTFEVYQKTHNDKSDESLNRRKEIASRSMERSSSAPNESQTPAGRMNFSRAKNEINKMFNQ